MNLRKLGWTMILIFGLSVPKAQAAGGADTAAFLSAATGDFQSIANFVNGPFTHSLGFFTGLGWNTNPTVYDFVSGPHFSLSVAAGADFITMPNLANLNLPVVSASSAFSLPSGVPLPFPVITGRIGLFNGFDAGFRYTYLPPINAGTFGGNFNGWGIDLRYKIFDGMTSPTVTLSTSFDTMTGTFNVAANNISQTVNYTAPSSTNYPSATFTGNANYALNWTTRSVGAKVTIGKNIGILYPYAAVGFQRNSGNISSTVSGSFSANLDGAGTSNPSVVSAGEPAIFEPKYVVGLDLGGGPGLQLAAVGESNGTDIAGTFTLGAGF